MKVFSDDRVAAMHDASLDVLERLGTEPDFRELISLTQHFDCHHQFSSQSQKPSEAKDT